MADRNLLMQQAVEKIRKGLNQSEDFQPMTEEERLLLDLTKKQEMSNRAQQFQPMTEEEQSLKEMIAKQSKTPSISEFKVSKPVENAAKAVEAGKIETAVEKVAKVGEQVASAVAKGTATQTQPQVQPQEQTKTLPEPLNLQKVDLGTTQAESKIKPIDKSELERKIQTGEKSISQVPTPDRSAYDKSLSSLIEEFRKQQSQEEQGTQVKQRDIAQAIQQDIIKQIEQRGKDYEDLRKEAAKPRDQQLLAQAVLAFAPILAGYAMGGNLGGVAGAQAGQLGLEKFKETQKERQDREIKMRELGIKLTGNNIKDYVSLLNYERMMQSTGLKAKIEDRVSQTRQNEINLRAVKERRQAADQEFKNGLMSREQYSKELKELREFEINLEKLKNDNQKAIAKDENERQKIIDNAQKEGEKASQGREKLIQGQQKIAQKDRELDIKAKAEASKASARAAKAEKEGKDLDLGGGFILKPTADTGMRRKAVDIVASYNIHDKSIERLKNAVAALKKTDIIGFDNPRRQELEGAMAEYMNSYRKISDSGANYSVQEMGMAKGSAIDLKDGAIDMTKLLLQQDTLVNKLNNLRGFVKTNTIARLEPYQVTYQSKEPPKESGLTDRQKRIQELKKILGR